MIDPSGGIALLPVPESLELEPIADTIDETASLQLNAVLRLDDGTSIPLEPSMVNWTAIGALASVSPQGLVTAAAVYEDSPGDANAVFGVATNGHETTLHLEATRPLTVLDSLPDNFTTSPYNFAGDGLPDAWQVAHYSLGDHDANPMADGDGDSQPALLEYFFNTNPVDASSLHVPAVDIVSGPDSRKYISLTFQVREELDSLWDWTPQVSNTLDSVLWTEDVVRIDDGSAVTIIDDVPMVIQTWRATESVEEGAGSQFMRVRITAP